MLTMHVGARATVAHRAILMGVALGILCLAPRGGLPASSGIGRVGLPEVALLILCTLPMVISHAIATAVIISVVQGAIGVLEMLVMMSMHAGRRSSLLGIRIPRLAELRILLLHGLLLYMLLRYILLLQRLLMHGLLMHRLLLVHGRGCGTRMVHGLAVGMHDARRLPSACGAS